MAHTAGPWRHHLGVVIADTPDAQGHKTKAVAYVGEEFRHLGGLQDGDEREANARLIAAAPDLLAALTDLHQTCEKLGYFGSAMDNAREAIAKATQP